MKNIIKTILFLFISLILISCENEINPTVSSNGFELRNDATIIAPSVLTDDLDNNVFGKYNWDISNNGPSSVSKYSLFIFDHDNDPNLENGVEYTGLGVNVTSEDRDATLMVKEFNDLVNLLPTFKCSQMNIDIRIKSTLGVNPADDFVQYSNPITYTITPYSTKMQKLAFVKESTDPKSAPFLLSSTYSSNIDFEGYLFLEAGNYKFYQPDACHDFTSPTIYGGINGTGGNGTLDNSATPVSINVAEAGYYLVKVNIDANTYSVRKYRAFGVFGKATRTGFGFNNSVPMNDDDNDNVWKLTIELIKGEKFKFKSNDWTGDLVAATPPNMPYIPGSATSFISILGKLTDGIAENNGADITVPGSFNNNERQKYDVELDISNPRAYTYKLTLNPN